MKRIILVTILSASFAFAEAQTLTPTVISTAGAYTSAGGVSLSYTIGEMAAVETFTAGNTILTQGFQQPNDYVNGLLDIEKGPDGAFSVYPVPAQNTLWYGYEFSETGKVEIEFFDMTGKKLEYTYNEGYATGKQVHSFDCSAYASGNYILTVKFKSTAGQEKVLSKKVQLIN